MNMKLSRKTTTNFVLATENLAHTRKPKISRKFLENLFITLALCINYMCVLLSTILFRLEVAYFLVIVFILSFLAGILIADLKNCVICGLTSMIVGSMITVALIIMPQSIHGELFEKVYGGVRVIDVLLDQTFKALAPLLLLGILPSFVGVMLGSLFGDVF